LKWTVLEKAKLFLWSGEGKEEVSSFIMMHHQYPLQRYDELEHLRAELDQEYRLK
jgi:hypothetical protein